MSSFGKANSFYDRNVPGDPRLLDAMSRQIPSIAGDHGINHYFGSTVLTPSKKGGQRAAPVLCPFGEIVTYQVTIEEVATNKTGIRGGLLIVGDRNYNVEHHAINLETPGVWLISLQIECESKRDTNNQIFLPGIKTCEETDSEEFWDAKAWVVGPPATSYDNSTHPVFDTGLGMIVVPLGKLTITASGVEGSPNSASFEPLGCGHITIGQCAGNLSYARA